MTLPASRPRTVMIVAGETSGDMHGGRLVLSLLARDPSLRFCGMGGSAMRAAGVEMLYDAGKVAVMGLFEVAVHLRDILAAFKILTTRLRRQPPDLLVLIDLPDFNTRLAARAKGLGIPVLYYICPQVWAWRSNRARKLASLVDRMAVILPFEKAFYQRYGVEVTYVGHPLLDSEELRRTPLKRGTSLPPCIGLLPGSRPGEIKRMLPLFLETARHLHRVFPGAEFLLPLAPDLDVSLLKEHLGRQHFTVTLVREERYAAMARCDAVMAASGTVTLELALLRVPAVIAYRMHPLTFFLARHLVEVPFVSLVNLIAGKEIVAELLQEKATAESVAARVAECCRPGPAREELLAGYTDVREKLGEPGASARVAAIVLDMLDRKSV
ncbi:MAG: lipid-A-disaccharide synthase [Thermodesulfobacteriota bacterium]